MRNFLLVRPDNVEAAVNAGAGPDTAYIAGGTDLMQLMKQEVERPARLVDLDGVLPDAIEIRPEGLRIGALARMADVAAHPEVQRNYRALSESLLSAASPQIRNMGTIGGNLLQRTRCSYFRDTGFACNKREPGSGCPAIGGDNRILAVLGVSEHCIATHPSDMPVALMAFDATVEVSGPDNANRTIPLAELYRVPGDSPKTETTLRPGEVIVAVVVPASSAAKRSAYVKVRDRESFAFALVSAAVGMEIADGTIRDARVAMGGVGTMPWRMPQVEAALRGQQARPEVFAAAASRASEGARAASGNGFKLRLMQRVAERALQSVAV
ncbi:MAG: xanthine dehydrogenase family protein subunit M [Acetobacteraceae bacterium]|nr:xanthine dehydrogenase family protein subunit M [Acetobacteraceae bacterium]